MNQRADRPAQDLDDTSDPDLMLVPPLAGGEDSFLAFRGEEIPPGEITATISADGVVLAVGETWRQTTGPLAPPDIMEAFLAGCRSATELWVVRGANKDGSLPEPPRNLEPRRARVVLEA